MTTLSIAIAVALFGAVYAWGPPPGGRPGGPGGPPGGRPFGPPPPGGPGGPGGWGPPPPPPGPGGPQGPPGGWGPPPPPPPPPCPADPNRAKETENKRLTMELYDKVFGQKDVDALDALVCDDTIEHNPDVGDGLQAFKDFLNTIPPFQQKIQEKVEVTQINAEGDMVWTQRREVNPATGKVRSVIDMLRFCDRGTKRCVCEHWDTMQDIPDNAVSTHPMFS